MFESDRGGCVLERPPSPPDPDSVPLIITRESLPPYKWSINEQRVDDHVQFSAVRLFLSQLRTRFRPECKIWPKVNERTKRHEDQKMTATTSHFLDRN